jgi:DNA invertase Pin-like site-specific DNA recombinase
MIRPPVVYGYLRETAGSPPGDVERQRAELQQYIQEHLPEFGCAGLFVDEADQYDRPLGTRREGGPMCRAADPHDHVVVLRFAHAFLSLRDFMDQVGVLAARRVQTHVVDLGWKPLGLRAPALSLAFRALLEAERSLARERGRADFARRRRRGLALNGHAPPGFRYVGPRGKRRLVRDEYAGALARRLIEWRRQGWSWEQIYWHLREHRFTTRDGRAWSVTALRRLHDAERSLRAREAVVQSGVEAAATV